MLTGLYSNVAGTTTLANVTGFAKQSSTDSSITVKWNRNSRATGYVLEQYTGGKWVQLTKTASNTNTSYTAKNLKASTTYTFRIKTYKTVNGKTTETAYIRLAARTPAPRVTKEKDLRQTLLIRSESEHIRPQTVQRSTATM